MARAFMTDPGQLTSLEGQQYLVLRPARSVAAFYGREQATILAGLPGGVPHPSTGHVTLRGFFEPTRVAEVRAAVAAWADAQAPIDLTVEAVDGFPPPFQVVIARLTRSASLVDAYASLTAMLDTMDFCRIGELPLDDWVFHLSLVYCGALSEDDWHGIAARTSRPLAEQVSETVAEVEFVWYQDGVEHAEVLPLGGAVPGS